MYAYINRFHLAGGALLQGGGLGLSTLGPPFITIITTIVTIAIIIIIIINTTTTTITTTTTTTTTISINCYYY